MWYVRVPFPYNKRASNIFDTNAQIFIEIIEISAIIEDHQYQYELTHRLFYKDVIEELSNAAGRLCIIERLTM